MKKLLTLFAVVSMAFSALADTVYFVNKQGWSAPNCYAWSGQGGEGNQNAGWPGLPMTKESYQLAGYDVYSYTADPAWENCIFNGGGSQTADLTWTSDMYFFAGNWKTRTELEQGQSGDQQQGGARYYWKGFVDGEDVEPTDATLFAGGQSSISVAQDGYIFVIYQVDGQQGVQYMTEAYTDGVSHATLYVDGKGGFEKLHVPAGDYTLYLYDNGDGSLELSTEVLAGKTLVSTDQPQAVDNVALSASVRKAVMNGQLVIIRDGVTYSVQGARL